MTYDEKFRAVLRQVITDNTKKEFIEIWDKQHLVKNYDLSGLDVHGNVYTDSKTTLRFSLSYIFLIHYYINKIFLPLKQIY